jgi:hypothetical protein
MVKRLITLSDIDYITHKTSCENKTINKYNLQLIKRCGSVLPMTNEGKEIGLLCHNIQKCNTQLSRKKTSVSNDRIYRLLYDKASENNKNCFIMILNDVLARPSCQVLCYVKTDLRTSSNFIFRRKDIQQV